MCKTVVRSALPFFFFFFFFFAWHTCHCIFVTRKNLVCNGDSYLTHSHLIKGAFPGPRKQNSTEQSLTNISVITETGDSWEGRCAGVSRSAK